jgi:hypothetical protein
MPSPVPGVDVLLIGPSDLSIELGVPAPVASRLGAQSPTQPSAHPAHCILIFFSTSLPAAQKFLLTWAAAATFSGRPRAVHECRSRPAPARRLGPRPGGT